MSRAVVVLAGVASLLLLTWLTLFVYRGPIEADLELRVERRLAPLGVAELRVEARGRDLSVGGTLPATVAAAEVERLAGSVAGVRVVDTQALSPAPPLTADGPDAARLLVPGRIDPVSAIPGQALDAAACQNALAHIAAAGELRVVEGSAEPSLSSYPILNELAAAAARCPDTRIIVAGHTDDSGDPVADLRLSRLRAEAVAAFFRIAGIPDERLQTVGYGGSRPVADNATPAGRAANKRITIAVAPRHGAAGPRSTQ